MYDYNILYEIIILKLISDQFVKQSMFYIARS